MKKTAGIYVRISQDRDGKALGVARQEEDCRALCERRGWTVADVYRDNDVSASSGRKRPEYERLLADVEAGRLSAVAVWALDRLHRRPVELERFIDLADRHAVALGSVGGDVDLSTSGGRLHARMMGAVARHEIEAKSDRTKRAQLQAAQAGKWLGGARPFGWTVRDGGTAVLDRREASEVRRLAAAVLAGASLGSLVRDLNARGVLTTTGRAWSYTTLRQLLTRPRNAGLSVLNGETVGQSAWPPLVSEAAWRGVVALLGDPARRTATTNRARWLLSGLALCGVCGQPVKSGTVTSNRRTGTKRTVYRCHVARSAVPVDELVAGVVIGRLSRPDAADLLTDAEAPDAEGLREEGLAVRAQLDEVAAMYAEGAVTAAQLRTATERLRGRLAAVEDQQATSSRAPILADLVRARDVRALWDALPLDRRRAVVSALLTVTLLPSGRSGNGFDPELVQIEW